MQNGAALLLPLKNFSSYLSFIDKAIDMELAFTSNRNLSLFCTYLTQLENVKDHLAIEAIVHDIERGLYLWSNIPSGYGVGSSGAVCAALYRTYGKHHWKAGKFADLQQLRIFFGNMESFFHGTSSGIDPLACYLANPLIVNPEKIEILNSVQAHLSNWLLIDSNISRKTELQVGNFIKKCTGPVFKDDFTRNYIPFVDQVINSCDSNNDVNNSKGEWFTNAIEAISEMQLHFFPEMIPCSLKTLWRYGLDTGMFYMKLLGAGGGGYYLCYSCTQENASSYIVENGFKTLSLSF